MLPGGSRTGSLHGLLYGMFLGSDRYGFAHHLLTGGWHLDRDLDREERDLGRDIDREDRDLNSDIHRDLLDVIYSRA